MDGQCKCGLEGEGTVGGGDAKPCSVAQATSQIHRLHIEMENEALKEEEE